MSGTVANIRPARPSARGLAVVLRALFVYLFLVWIMIRFASVAEQGKAHLALIAGAILVGFPITAGVARLLHRRLPAGLSGGWRVSLAAVAAALILPVTCLKISGSAGPTESTLNAMDHHIVPAALMRELTSADDFDGLRLRIRGLSIANPRPAPEGQPGGGVMLLLDTSLREAGEGRHILIEVRLIEERGDRVLWRDEYVADPEDLSDLRRAVIRALSEGMSRTREGIAEGQLI